MGDAMWRKYCRVGKVGKGRMGEVSGGGIKSERKRGRGLF